MPDPVPVLVESVPAPVVETPTPPAPVVTETPIPPQDTQTPDAPAAEKLFDLPDGRKVDAEGLRKEYENLLPEFTRKSQKLAEYENINKPPADNVPAWKRDDYVPKTYAEVIEIAKQEAIEDLRRAAQAEDQQLRDVTAAVDTQLATIKAKDPSLDENALFVHANKWGFKDLGQAYENMKYEKQIALETEQRVLANFKKRGDPVAGLGGGVTPDSRIDPNTRHNYGSALEFLQRIKGN